MSSPPTLTPSKQSGSPESKTEFSDCFEFHDEKWQQSETVAARDLGLACPVCSSSAWHCGPVWPDCLPAQPAPALWPLTGRRDVSLPWKEGARIVILFFHLILCQAEFSVVHHVVLLQVLARCHLTSGCPEFRQKGCEKWAKDPLLVVQTVQPCSCFT